jgi:hypothetical protein
MSKRLVGVLALVLMLLPLAAVPAFAVDAAEESVPGEAPEDAPAPTIDEIGTQNETAREFFPEPYESPSVLPPLLFLLLGIAAVVALIVLVLFLVWQPRFAQERRTGSKGRR